MWCYSCLVKYLLYDHGRRTFLSLLKSSKPGPFFHNMRTALDRNDSTNYSSVNFVRVCVCVYVSQCASATVEKQRGAKQAGKLSD